jgi:stage V sporulation protein SpoVS
MKATPLLFLLAGLAIAGCGDEKSNPVTAPVDYIGSAVKKEQSAIKTIDTTALNQAVQLFNVQEGRLPKDLNELVEKKYIGKLPDAPAGMKLSYDANDGKVAVVKE